MQPLATHRWQGHHLAGLDDTQMSSMHQKGGTAHHVHLEEAIGQLLTMDEDADVSLFLQNTMARFELDHCVYLARSLPDTESVEPVFLTTYPADWVSRYMAQGYVYIDPVLKLAERTILPIDWGDIRRKSTPVRRLFSESRDFGVGAQGLTFSICGPRGDRAQFSVNSHLKNADWLLVRPELMREMQLFAHYLHQHMMERTCTDLRPVTLTRRETQTLSLAAQGCSAKEIARHLRVSPAAVRAYLDSARFRLQAINRTHAAVKATKLGLI
jgi:DNA-binding CsgD family transcriptional regulator